MIGITAHYDPTIMLGMGGYVLLKLYCFLINYLVAFDGNIGSSTTWRNVVGPQRNTGTTKPCSVNLMHSTIEQSRELIYIVPNINAQQSGFQCSIKYWRRIRFVINTLVSSAKPPLKYGSTVFVIKLRHTLWSVWRHFGPFAYHSRQENHTAVCWSSKQENDQEPTA